MSKMTCHCAGITWEIGERKNWGDVFRCFLKTVSDGADVTFCGWVFHSWESATGKAWSLMVERRVRRTTNDKWLCSEPYLSAHCMRSKLGPADWESNAIITILLLSYTCKLRAGDNTKQNIDNSSTLAQSLYNHHNSNSAIHSLHSGKHASTIWDESKPA